MSLITLGQAPPIPGPAQRGPSGSASWGALWRWGLCTGPCLPELPRVVAAETVCMHECSQLLTQRGGWTELVQTLPAIWPSGSPWGRGRRSLSAPGFR